jgi:hypothetical protein
MEAGTDHHTFYKEMKVLRLIIIISLAVLISCSGDKTRVPASVVNIPNSATGDENKDNLPMIQFSVIEHDFGKVIQGEIVSFAFKFKNTGNSDLVIANISTSCGCTASEYPKTPVKPGEEEKIEVIFDSSNRQGFQNKTLEVAANTQPTNTTLTIKAMVVIPEKQ